MVRFSADIIPPHISPQDNSYSFLEPLDLSSSSTMKYTNVIQDCHTTYHTSGRSSLIPGHIGHSMV